MANYQPNSENRTSPPPPPRLPATNDEEEQNEEEEDTRCFLANLSVAVEQVYLILTKFGAWMIQNEMDQCCNPTNSPLVGNKRNIIILIAILHVSFDVGAFVFVSKPWVSSPSALTTNADPTSTAKPQYAFVAHVLGFHPAAKDVGIYHNIAIQPKYIRRVAHEYLFARFALAIFPYLNLFVKQATVSKRILILNGRGTTKTITAKPGEIKAREQKAKKGTSRTSSKKRPRSSSDEHIDAYEERLRCRSASRVLSDCGYDYPGWSKYWDLLPKSDNVPGLTGSFSTDANNAIEAWIDAVPQESQEEFQARQDKSGPKKNAL
ncbi:hypothetical protein F4680DRAFT_252205 [Xylaria scruposa]|nr:hypothetical protein F4680DRAFT_252205 [Xylaria scruposa]